MNCETCGVEMVERIVTADAPYKYKQSGMKNVYLVGISICECSKCGERYPVIPKIGELHSVIAKAIISKDGLLSGEEVRFLRKNVGLNGVRFAALLGIGHTHLSKVEAGTKKLSRTVDKMARLLAEVANDGENFRGILLKHADRKIEEKERTSVAEKKIFGLGDDRWQQLEIAA